MVAPDLPGKVLSCCLVLPTTMCVCCCPSYVVVFWPQEPLALPLFSLSDSAVSHPGLSSAVAGRLSRDWQS
ncbi:hypothetical protein V8C86DRAFT_2969493 [Haematococcus lacustris]